MENFRIGSIIVGGLTMIVFFALVKWGLNASGKGDLATKF